MSAGILAVTTLTYKQFYFRLLCYSRGTSSAADALKIVLYCVYSSVQLPVWGILWRQVGKCPRLAMSHFSPYSRQKPAAGADLFVIAIVNVFNA